MLDDEEGQQLPFRYLFQKVRWNEHKNDKQLIDYGEPRTNPSWTYCHVQPWQWQNRFRKPRIESWHKCYPKYHLRSRKHWMARINQWHGRETKKWVWWNQKSAWIAIIVTIPKYRQNQRTKRWLRECKRQCERSGCYAKKIQTTSTKSKQQIFDVKKLTLLI